MRTDLDDRKNEILSWITDSNSKAWICVQLKCRAATFDSWLKRNQIEYKGNQGLKGKKNDLKRLSAIEYTKTLRPSTAKLKRKLFEDGLRAKECSRCKIKTWQGEPAPLQLDHIDGNRFNNLLANLRILCANCHCLTDTHSGKNIGKYS
jgi:hypothetical protein